MQEGTIVRINPKGFGFITQEGKDKDLFFHATGLVGIAFDQVREGDKVRFEVATTDDGRLNAVQVTVVN